MGNIVSDNLVQYPFQTSLSLLIVSASLLSFAFAFAWRIVYHYSCSLLLLFSHGTVIAHR